MDQSEAARKSHSTPEQRRLYRLKSAYERRTPQKIARGVAMVLARERAGYTQDRAAELLGYASAVQLCQMETGKRSPPLRILIRVACMYGTTTDHLLGRTATVHREPAAAMRERIGEYTRGALLAEAQRLAAAADLLRTQQLQAALHLLPIARGAMRLAEVFQLARAEIPDFDDMPAGALLANRIESAAELAGRYAEQVARGYRQCAVRQP